MDKKYIHFRRVHRNTKYKVGAIILVFLTLLTLFKLSADLESSDIHNNKDTRQTISYLLHKPTSSEIDAELRKEPNRLKEKYKSWNKMTIFVYNTKNPTIINKDGLSYIVNNFQPKEYIDFLHNLKVARLDIIGKLNLYCDILIDFVKGEIINLHMSQDVIENLLYFNDNLESLLLIINADGEWDSLVVFHENFIKNKIEILVKISNQFNNRIHSKNRTDENHVAIDEINPSFVLDINENEKYNLIELIKRKHIIIDFLMLVHHIFIKQNIERVFFDLKIDKNICSELDRRVIEIEAYITALNKNMKMVNIMLLKIDTVLHQFGRRAFNLFEFDFK